MKEGSASGGAGAGSQVWDRAPDGRLVRRLVLGRAPGPVIHLLDLGATVQRLEVTGGDGHRRNIVLGYESADAYLRSSHYLGGTIGRYANRISGGRFSLDGRQIQLPTHDRGNHLHGGPDGFDRRTWAVDQQSGDKAVLTLKSPHGDQGFPGALVVFAQFTVSENGVRIEYEATSDATTVVNLTNHAYFNLEGDRAGTIDGHQLVVEADHYTPVDDTGIPLGPDEPVDDSPFDFRLPRPLAEAMRAGHAQVRSARGIDHNLVIRGRGMRPAARLIAASTATELEVRSDQPGLQVYTGNFLDGSAPVAGDRVYRQGDGIALEPQLRPNAPGESPGEAVLRPGETYRAHIEWIFRTVLEARLGRTGSLRRCP